MTQEHPPDAQLMAVAIEDAADASVRAHADGCPTCGPRVAAARAVAAALRSAAPGGRTWCPPRELLCEAAPASGPWGGGVLGRHLSACPFCRDDVRDLRALEAPAPSTVRALHRLVLSVRAAARAAAQDLLELVETTLAPQPVPALVPVRGETGTVGVVVAAPFGAGSLEVTASAAGGKVDLRVRALGDAPRAWRLAVSAGDPLELVESRSADAQGVVVVADLEPGRYRLEAFGPQRQAADTAIDVVLQLDG